MQDLKKMETLKPLCFVFQNIVAFVLILEKQILIGFKFQLLT